MSKEEHDFIKQLKFLKKQRGQGTELISVYLPPNSNVNEVSARLRDEYGQASNIKSKQTRKNVQTAIDKIISVLKGVHKPPEHGAAIFCGNIDGKIQLFTITPPEDVNVSVYRCDSTFFTEPLEELIGKKDEYGLLVMDRREATFATLKGKKTTILKQITSGVPGKHHKGGQCVHSDSLVQLECGDITEIKNVSKGDRIASFNKKSYQINNEKCDKVFRRTWGEYYKIRTKSPCLELKVTPEHWFFVADNYGIGLKYAEDLKEGDQVLVASKMRIKGRGIKTNVKIPIIEEVTKEGIAFLVNRRKQLGLTQKQVADKIGVHPGSISKLELMTGKISIEKIRKIAFLYKINWDNFSEKYIKKKKKFNFPKTITPELCQFIGYFMGDGNKEKIRVRFYDEDKQLIDYYAGLVKRLFNVNVSVKRREKRGYYKATFYGEELVNGLEKTFEGAFEKSRRLEIPKNIMRNKEKQVAFFIKGLYDAEGYVRKDRIGISMVSEKLIKQLQIILLRFGIISSVREKYSKPNYRVKRGSKQYELEISDNESLIKFRKSIGFSSEKKMNKLKKIKISGTTKTNQIPAKGKHILELSKKIGLTTRSFNTSTNFFRNERSMSKPVFEKTILEKAKMKTKQENIIKEFEKILNSDAIQATIVKKEKVNKEEDFYDLSVPKTECFIANNFILHNSAQRFSRLIEGAAHDFFKRIGELANSYFANSNIKAVIIGGPGGTKDDFIKKDYLFNSVKEKIAAVIDTGYTDEFGIRELVEKAGEVVRELETRREKEIVDKFIKEAVTNGLATYGEKQVKEALEEGKVSKLLVSEGLPEEKIEELEELAEQTDSEIEIISTDTVEGEQFFKAFGGIGAMLRYR